MSVKEIDVIRFWSPRNGAAMTDERFEALRHELRPELARAQASGPAPETPAAGPYHSRLLRYVAAPP